MAQFDENLVNRIREALIFREILRVEERILFRGMCFMIDEKMCICVRENSLMCRVGPDLYESALERNGVTPMIHNGRKMMGYVFVDEDGFKNTADFGFWMDACLAFNKIAKASKKKSKP